MSCRQFGNYSETGFSESGNPPHNAPKPHSDRRTPREFDHSSRQGEYSFLAYPQNIRTFPSPVIIPLTSHGGIEKLARDRRFPMKAKLSGPPALAAVLLFLVSVPIFAHHGAASYDISKMTSLKGTETKKRRTAAKAGGPESSFHWEPP